MSSLLTSLSRTPFRPISPRWVSGAYYDTRSFYGGSTTASSPTGNSIYASPIYVPTPITVDRIGINVTSGAGTVARLMLYAYDPTTGLPGALLLDAGTVDPSTNGDKEATISYALPAGIVYGAVVIDAGATIQTVNNTYASVYGASTPAGTVLRGSPNKANGGTTAPSTFGTPSAYSSVFIRISLRAV